MSKIFSKSNKKMIITIVASVLAAVTLVGVLGQTFGLFNKDLKDITLRDRNEDNVITLDNITLEEYDDGNGVKATVEKDGRVKLSGKSETSNDIKIEYAKLELAPGEYTLVGAPKGSNGSYHLVADYNGKEYISDFNNNKFTVTAKATVTISIVVKPDTLVYATLYPVLYTGADEVSFYA